MISATLGALAGTIAGWGFKTGNLESKLSIANLSERNLTSSRQAAQTGLHSALRNEVEKIIDGLFGQTGSGPDEASKANAGKIKTAPSRGGQGSLPVNELAKKAIFLTKRYVDEFIEKNGKIPEAAPGYFSKDNTQDAPPLAIGIVLAAVDFSEPHGAAYEKAAVDAVVLRGFLWAYAAALHLHPASGVGDHLLRCLSTSPREAAEFFPAVAQIFEVECLRILKSLPLRMSAEDLGKFYTVLFSKDSKLAAKALQLTSSEQLGPILSHINDPRAVNAGEFLGFLLENGQIDLTNQPRELLTSLAINHPKAFGEWGLRHWDKLPRDSLGLVELALQKNVDLARQLLSNPPEMKQDSWKSVSQHLAYALATQDAPAFKEFIQRQPTAQREFFLDSVITLLGTRDPVQAAKMVEEYGKSSSLSPDSINTIVDGLTIANPEGVSAFLKLLPSDAAREASVHGIMANFRVFRGDEALQLADQLMAEPTFVADAFAVKECLSAVSRELVETTGDPSRAVDWVRTLPTPALRDQAALQLGEIWLRNDPAGAATYLLSQPPNAERTRLLMKAGEQAVDPTVLAAIRAATAPSP